LGEKEVSRTNLKERQTTTNGKVAEKRKKERVSTDPEQKEHQKRTEPTTSIYKGAAPSKSVNKEKMPTRGRRVGP